MKMIIKILVALNILSAQAYSSSQTIYDFKVKKNDGSETSLSEYKGKVLLIVNVASQCGFTPQYKGLQELYDKYKSQGFVILGFPSNQFGGQEPGSDAEIKKFCELNFGVNFPLFSKGDVKGKTKRPLFKFLTEDGNEALTGEILWNFEKFLINKNGQLVDRYRSITKPNNSKLDKRIQELLSH